MLVNMEEEMEDVVLPAQDAQYSDPNEADQDKAFKNQALEEEYDASIQLRLAADTNNEQDSDTEPETEDFTDDKFQENASKNGFEDHYKEFLQLKPADLLEQRKISRSRIQRVSQRKEVDLRDILQDLQSIREMLEDGILLLNNLQMRHLSSHLQDSSQERHLTSHLQEDPSQIYDVIQQSVTSLLKGLKQHIFFQEQFLYDSGEENRLDPMKVVKQELTEFGDSENHIDDLVEKIDDHIEKNDDSEEELKLDDCDSKLDASSEIKLEKKEIYENKGPDNIATHKKSSRKSQTEKSVRKPRQRKKRLSPAADGSYMCDQCDQRFPKYQQLVRHLGRHNKPFKCDQCFKGFATKGDLVSHSMQVHDGERRFPCEVCPRKFFKKTDLERHIQMHNGVKPFKCEFCFHAFTTSGNLTKHVRRHTGEKPFACDVCPKAFVSTGDLVEHKRIHTGEKPFQCHICNKNFARTGHLKRHIKTHSGVKPYQCEVCQKCFTCRGNLKEHMNTHDRIKTE